MANKEYNYLETLTPEKPYNYSYEQTVNYTITVFDENNLYNAEDILNIIKTVDTVMVGTKKICFLKGWQYNGEDTGFPAFFEVNNCLKREKDASAKESLDWLIAEAKAFNTTVSLSINLTHAKKNSPLYSIYEEKDLLLKNADGNLLYTKNNFGNKVNLIDLSKELECGYLERRIERLNEILPLKKVGVILVEEFELKPSFNVKIDALKEARNKIIKLFKKLGADICLDYLYYEKEDGVRKESLIGRVPFIFNLSQSLMDYMSRPCSLLCGGKTSNLYKECESANMKILFGESVDIATLLKTPKTLSKALFKEFCTKYLKYRFLNGLDRLTATVTASDVIVNFSKNVTTYLKEDRLTINGVTAKDGNELVIPTDFIEKGSAVVYTEKGGQIDWNLSKILGFASSQNIELSEINENGLSEKKRFTRLNNGMLELDLKPGKEAAYLISRL